MKENDTYLKIVEWSEENSCYVGSVPGRIGKCCHGDDDLEVYRELCAILYEWIDIYQKDGQPLPRATNRKYSGKFFLRTGRELQKALTIRELDAGESLNNYVVKILKSEVSG